MGHVVLDGVLSVECEFEVTVRDDGFTFTNCGGTFRPMTYDPQDREYPFKGRIRSESFWLAPSR